VTFDDNNLNNFNSSLPGPIYSNVSVAAASSLMADFLYQNIQPVVNGQLTLLNGSYGSIVAVLDEILEILQVNNQSNLGGSENTSKMPKKKHRKRKKRLNWKPQSFQDLPSELRDKIYDLIGGNSDKWHFVDDGVHEELLQRALYTDKRFIIKFHTFNEP
jgi:hypothetical protein